MVSKRLKSLRRSRQLSQMELASRARVSQSYLSRLEKGVLDNPSSEVVQRLADALDVPVALLYTSPGEEALALRGDLQQRIESAVSSAGSDPETATERARAVLDRFIRDLERDHGPSAEIADWGRRFIEGRVALLRFSLLERHGMDGGATIPVEGVFEGSAGEGGELRPAEDPPFKLPGRMAALRIAREGLVSGAGPGDRLLYAPGVEPRQGDLAVVRRGNRRFIRRVYPAGEGQVLLVPPGSPYDAALPPGTYSSAEVEFEGRISGILYSSS